MTESLPALTPKRRRFLDEYMIDGNAARAARAAGYRPSAAAYIGYQLLKLPAIRAEIAARQAALAEAAGVSAAQVLEETKRIAFASPCDYVQAGPDGDEFIPVSKLPRDLAAAVAQVTIDGRFKDGRRVTYKLHDKLPALGTLGKHVGLYKDEKPTAPNLGFTKIERIIVDPED